MGIDKLRELSKKINFNEFDSDFSSFLSNDSLVVMFGDKCICYVNTKLEINIMRGFEEVPIEIIKMIESLKCNTKDC